MLAFVHRYIRDRLAKREARHVERDVCRCVCAGVQGVVAVFVFCCVFGQLHVTQLANCNILSWYSGVSRKVGLALP